MLIIFETFHYYYNSVKYEHIDNLIRNKIFERKVNGNELEDEKLNKKYVLYENMLVDVSKFTENHPGGRNLIIDNLYLDVGRYLTGTQGYSTGINPNTHNYWTIKYLVNNLAYAELIQEHQLLVNTVDNTNYIEKYLKISSKREIAKHVFEYQFKDENFRFSKFIPGHKWLGRHFSISYSYLSKTRYYTTCLTLDSKYKRKLNVLLDNSLKGYVHTKGMEVEFNEKSANYITFYIKRYNEPEALSNALHDENSEFKIKGPFVREDL
jgi:hypothetical protein